MHATFLGTGSAMPTAGRAQSGVLVEGEDRSVLVDCGSGVLGRLQEYGPRPDPETAPYEALDGVVVTHHHLDHVADLLPLMKARWLAGATPLPIAGPRRTTGLLARLIAVHDYLDGRLEYSVQTLSDGATVEFQGINITAYRTTHTDASLGYRLTPADDTDPSIVVTGDTEADPELLAWAEGSDLLIHDCSFPNGVDVSNHPTAGQLGRALAGHEFGTVALTHLYPHADNAGNALRAGVTDQYDGEVVIAEDGLTIAAG